LLRNSDENVVVSNKVIIAFDKAKEVIVVPPLAVSAGTDRLTKE
jgi:hypothetical protein